MSATRLSKALVILGMSGALSGCEEEPASAPKPEATKPAEPAVTAPPKPTASVAPEPPAPKADCPENSSGDGTFNKPCEAKGKERLMEVKWTGKMTDTGPSFRVMNKAKLPILYGRMAAYFYDKAGKQLQAGKDSPVQWCAGKIFQGPMKVAEKAVITFSCVNKSHVPEGTTHVEAEMQMVGFTDDEGKQTSFYWRNKDLTPDAREKGAK